MTPEVAEKLRLIDEKETQFTKILFDLDGQTLAELSDLIDKANDKNEQDLFLEEHPDGLLGVGLTSLAMHALSLYVAREWVERSKYGTRK